MAEAADSETQGTLRAAAGFDKERDATVLHKAMKGLGTDEKAIIDVLGYRTADQRVQIKEMYVTAYGRNLVSDLKSELSGHFEDICVALTNSMDEFDACEIRRSVEGLGTDDDCLIEILCTRNNAQIKQIQAAYKRLFEKDIASDLSGDTSGHFRKLLISLSTGNRMETQVPDRAKAARDAQALYAAGAQHLGTDEGEFNRVFGTQSLPQLRLVFEEYTKIAKHDILSAISREMSGNVATAYETLIKACKSPQEYFAEQLYKSMKGAGTKDRTLIRIVVTRAEVDMVQIKQLFQSHCGKSLESFISEDTSGDYKEMLLALVGAR